LLNRDGQITSSHQGLTWKVGEWKKEEKPLEICSVGLHCSENILDALSYVSGEYLARVEVRGEHVSKEDSKEAWSEMRLKKVYRWTKKDSVALAVFAAEQVIGIYEKYKPEDKRPRNAIEAAKRWLLGEISDEELKEVRRADAAAAYAYAATAYATTAAAAYAYATTAATAYAYAATAYATTDADAAAYAYAATATARRKEHKDLYKKIEKWLRRRVKELEELKK